MRLYDTGGTVAACFGFSLLLSQPLAPSHTKSKQTLKMEPVDPHTHIHTHAASVSRGRLSELRASRAMWDVVTLYLITFSQAVMNVAAALSTKAKTCLKHTVGTRFHCRVHIHTSTLQYAN